MQKNYRHKQFKLFLKLERDLDNVIDAIHNLGYVKLDKPVHIGYIYYLTVREDIAKSKLGIIYQQILNQYGKTTFSKHKYNVNMFKVFNHCIEPCQQELNGEISATRPWIKSVYKYIDRQEEYNKWIKYLHYSFVSGSTYFGNVEKYRFDIPSYSLIVKRKKHYITKIQEHDEILEQEKAYLEDKLNPFYRIHYSYRIPTWYRTVSHRSIRHSNKVKLTKLLQGYKIEFTPHLNTYW